MAYCQNCGHKLDPAAKFCPECGEPVAKKDMSTRHQKFAGEIIKCPNCGEVLNAFSSQCPTCGYELRDSDSSDSVKKFAQELKEIESGRKSERKFSSIGNAFANALGANTTNPIDQQLANRISNFAVPNTKEDIFEFMILAASNIDPMAHDTTVYGYSLAERPGKLMISNAWDSKYNQVHQKAKIMFPEDVRLTEIETLYKSKQKQIKCEKFKVLKIILPLIGALLALMVICEFSLGGISRKSEKREKELNAIVVDIQEDISNGDYDDALIKANSLRYDKSWNSEKAEQWDEQREYLINLINEKKEEN